MNRSAPLPDMARSLSREERGLILPLTLMILLILATLVASLLALGALEPQIAANVLRGNQALNLADAGAERAIAQFVADSTPVNTADCSPCPGAWVSPALFNVNLDNVGTYIVKYRPVSFATLLIESTGTTAVGSVPRKVRVVVTKHYVSRFGILGNQVDLCGTAQVLGAVGAIHGNEGASFGPMGTCTAFVEKTATSGFLPSPPNPPDTASPCTGCTAPRVGIPGGSGTGKPNEPLPGARPIDYRSRATILFGGAGEGSAYEPPVPSSCANVYQPDGTRIVPRPPTVGPSKILNVAAVSNANGSLPACTLTTAGPGAAPVLTGPFAGWKMGGSGDWSFASGTTPPDGAYYAADRIQIDTSGSGSLLGDGTPWKASFIAGIGSPQNGGEVQITGRAIITSYLDDALIVGGSIELEGTGGGTRRQKLTGTVISTSSPPGAVTFHGAADLVGNIMAKGNVSVSGTATVTYNVIKRTRTLSPTLKILSWSTVTQ